jgi:fermentation-respiration switch protein FrsA (DUF1100 family)
MVAAGQAANEDLMSVPPTCDQKPRTWQRRLMRWFFVVLAGYLGAIVVLMLLENWLVYKPAGPGDWQLPPNSLVEDIYLTSADGTTIHGWWYPRPGSSGAVVYFHGNAGNLSWRGNSLAVLHDQLGESVLIVDYPGYGKSGGSPSEAGCYAAADAAYDWLTKTQKISSENVLIYGASLGGSVAVDLASRKPHRALILVKTFTSLPDVGQAVCPYLPIHWLMRNRFDSLSKLERCKQPIFIAHGDADRLVPFCHGERLYQSARAPKHFLRLPGADHNDRLPAELFVELKKFLATTSSPAIPVAN